MVQKGWGQKRGQKGGQSGRTRGGQSKRLDGEPCEGAAARAEDGTEGGQKPGQKAGQERRSLGGGSRSAFRAPMFSSRRCS